MSRLAVLYALTEEELKKLQERPREKRYDFMLEEIEPALLETPRGCQLDKAWEGIQLCLGGGRWNERNAVPTNIIFGGKFLVETEEEIITLKSHSAVAKIVSYLQKNDLQEIIRNNVPRIDKQDYSLPLDENTKDYLLGWSEAILPFYENAKKGKYQVIFTVDL